MIEPGGLPPSDDAVQSLGGKAFNLLKLCSLGLPVPPGFVLPTSVGVRWVREGAPDEAAFKAMIAGPLDRLESLCGLGFGDPRKPLLLSVRSGAPVSMPGMLDTVLDVGLTRATLPGLIALTGNPRLAWDSYVRLIQSYAETVRHLSSSAFDEAAAKAMTAAGVSCLSELSTVDVRRLAATCLDAFDELAETPFPDDPYEQLRNAVDAVFRSWNSDRAVSYRRINRLEGLLGTAVTLQRMVYGNAGPRSGAGVGFTRDPATGDKRLYLDFAFDAQGEDVVSGRRRLTSANELQRLLPDIGRSLDYVAQQLEKNFRDAQDFEFTIEEGQLFLLQTRDAKRSAWARLKIAVDLVGEGLISPAEGLHRIEALDLTTLARRRIKGDSAELLGKGVPAGIGVATGAVAVTLDAARALVAQGKRVILVRAEIETQDIDGIAIAEGVLTARGGRTSHAAVVARELGKVAIVGCDGLEFCGDGACKVGNRRLDNGDLISLDGESGQIYAGTVAITEERPFKELALVSKWSAAEDRSASV